MQSRDGYQPTAGMTKEQKAGLKAERILMLFSKETRQGLRITCKCLLLAYINILYRV